MPIDSETIARVLALPPEQRVQLAQQLLDSVAEAPPIQLTPAQVAECDRRLAEMRSDPSKRLSAEEVWRRVHSPDER